MRGKQHNASVARRLAVAEEQVKDWKRSYTNERRERERLTAEVNLMPALRERVAIVEAQLELATCAEIGDLNRTVAKQREEIALLTREKDVLARAYLTVVRATTKMGHGMQEAENVAAAMRISLTDLVRRIDPVEYGEDWAARTNGGRVSPEMLRLRKAQPLQEDA